MSADSQWPWGRSAKPDTAGSNPVTDSMKKWDYYLVYPSKEALSKGVLQGNVISGTVEANDLEEAYRVAAHLIKVPDEDHMFANWYVKPVGVDFPGLTWQDLEIEAREEVTRV
jgi:hypothetical protein